METLTYKAKVRKDGSLSLSKQAREALGFKQGDEIEINIVTPIEKTQRTQRRTATRQNKAERKARIAAYLQECVNQNNIDAKTEENAVEELANIERVCPLLASPNVSTSVNRQVMFTWDKAEHHLLLEVFPDGSAELFSRNRLTNVLWGHDYQIGENLPEAVITRIRQEFEEC